MNRAWPVSDVEYPESDGQPMGETPLHQYWIIRLLDLFQQRYREHLSVYVASDLMVYYRQGDPRSCFVPDLIVLRGSDRRARRVLKLWEEPSPPSLVVEITSQSTRDQDEDRKMQLYAQLGIRDYFLFDPTADYLSPPLQGFRLEDGGHYALVVADDRGWLLSEQTGVGFSLSPRGELLLHDSQSGERLLTEAETERKWKELERSAKEQERQARDVERVKAERERAEKELERRAKELERQAKEQERDARLRAEARVSELEAELRRLRDSQ